MFGQNDNNQPQDPATSSTPDQTALGVAEQSVSGVTPQAEPSASATIASDDHSWSQAIGSHSSSTNDSITEESYGATPDKDVQDVISPAGGYPSSPNTRISSSGSDDNLATNDLNNVANDLLPSSVSNNNDTELIQIKQQALGELSPLIDKLDLEPDEKFHTIMMMIQSSDDESLVKKAYEAAHAIPDEKAHAQALLDVVNEINYFTKPDTTS